MNRAKVFITALTIGSAGCGETGATSPHQDFIASIMLYRDRRELEVGDSVSAWATGLNFDGTISTTPVGEAEWSSTPSGIVAFNSQSGGHAYIIGITTGRCVVNVTAAGDSGFGDFTVFPQVASLSISVDTQTVRVGDTIVVHVAIAWKNGAPPDGARPSVGVSAGVGSGIDSIWLLQPNNGETIKLLALAAGTRVLTVSLFGGRYTAAAPFTIAY